MSAREIRHPRTSEDVRRRLVHGSLTGITVVYIGLLILAPLVGIAVAALKPGLSGWTDLLSQPDVRHAIVLTGVITSETVVVTSVFGVIVAMVLARDRFPGRRLVSAIVDLPLAVSPVVVGLAAVLLFGTGGWFEPWFSARGIQILFAVPSMVLVTIFISIPFVIREVAPLLEELGTEEEEAARTLGASWFQTFFRVTLPNIRWVSGSIAGQTETATLYVLRAFDEGQDPSGYMVSLILALISIVLLAGIEIFKARQERELT
jgi:sulfate/thiosulfate transport system permease protein